MKCEGFSGVRSLFFALLSRGRPLKWMQATRTSGFTFCPRFLPHLISGHAEKKVPTTIINLLFPQPQPQPATIIYNIHPHQTHSPSNQFTGSTSIAAPAPSLPVPVSSCDAPLLPTSCEPEDEEEEDWGGALSLLSSL